MEENNTCKITQLNNPDTLIKVAEKTFASNRQKGLRLLKRAIKDMYSQKPATTYDVQEFLGRLDDLYPQHVNYYAKLASFYGELHLFEYVHYSLFKTLGDNMLIDKLKWNQISKDGSNTEPYLLGFLSTLGAISNYSHDYYLKTIDYNQRDEKPSIITDFKVVTPDGFLLPAMVYIHEGYTDNNISMAEIHMVRNEFKKAIAILEHYDLDKYPKAKADIAISYFLC